MSRLSPYVWRPAVRWGGIGALMLAALPIIMILGAWALGDQSYIAYLWQYGLLQEYLGNSVLIGVATVGVSAFLAIPTAWCVTMVRFRGARMLEWMLILPLAVPSYIAAMAYGYLFESAGPVQQMIREMTGLSYGEYPFFEIRSAGGMAFVLSMTLYPYMYLLARGAFIMQSRQIMESAMMLGASNQRYIWRVALPLARPACAAGAALIFMEALADFGVASLYGVPVCTTGIYRAWQSFYDPIATAQLASFLMLLVLLALIYEKYQRGRAHYANDTALYHPLERNDLRGWRGTAMAGLCAVPVMLGFIVPLLVLLYWGMQHADWFADPLLMEALWTSCLIAGVVALIALVVGLLSVYLMRVYGGKKRSIFAQLLRAAIAMLTSGYAIPGSVIAVGILFSFTMIEQQLFAGNLWMTGSFAGIIWACSLRFLTVSFHTMHSGLARITPMMDDAATMLGASSLRRLWRGHLPLLKSASLSALILVYIDTLKELPASLLLRPFDMHSLAIRAYELAKDDRLAQAAPAALLLIGVSLVPVLYLNARMNDSRPGHDAKQKGDGS